MAAIISRSARRRGIHRTAEGLISRWLDRRASHAGPSAPFTPSGAAVPVAKGPAPDEPACGGPPRTGLTMPVTTASPLLIAADAQPRQEYLAEVLDLLYPAPCSVTGEGPDKVAEYLVVPHARKPKMLIPIG